MLDQELDELEYTLLNKTIFKHDQHEDFITNLIHKTLKEISGDLDIYLRYISRFEAILRKSEMPSIAVLMIIFEKSYATLTQELELVPFDQSPIQLAAKLQDLSSFEKILEDRISQDNKIHLSSFYLDFSSLHIDEKKALTGYVSKIIQIRVEENSWKNEDISDIWFLICIAKNAAEQSNSLDFFYLSLSPFIEKINISRFFQTARDFSQEIVITSFKNRMQHYGFYLYFKAFSSQSNPISSLVYINLCLISLIHSRVPVSIKLVKEIIIQCVKMYRNLNLNPLAIEKFKSIPKKIKFDDFEYRHLLHSYLGALLQLKDKSFLDVLSESLNKHREQIISGGISECLPWLITIYNAKKIYGEAAFKSYPLQFYENIFESIVPDNIFKNYKELLLGKDAKALKDMFIAELLNISKTRFKDDFVIDVKHSIFIANKLISLGVNINSEELMLLAMLVKSDISIIFKNINLPNNKSVFPQKNLEQNFERHINNIIQNTLILKQFFPNSQIIWLAYVENRTVQLALDKEFFFNESELNDEKISSWLNANYDRLRFDDTVKDFNVRYVYEEEYLAQAKLILESLNFAKIKATSNEEVILIRDIELCEFPHNLFINQNSEFLFLKSPIINVMSIPWLEDKIKTMKISSGYSRGIRIPIKRGDFTINRLYSSLEVILSDYNFNIYDDIFIDSPLSYDLNILTAHGDEDISTISSLFTNDNEAVYNIGDIIGNGKILILFVCHSGSMKKGLFESKINSFVRSFLENGYQAVIAPFWPLHISIPPIWLKEFLFKFNSGCTLSQSFYSANLKVEEKYPTPGAWACLHFYGNPNLKL